MDEHTEPGLRIKKDKPYAEALLIILILLMFGYKLTQKDEPLSQPSEAPVVQVAQIPSETPVPEEAQPVVQETPVVQTPTPKPHKKTASKKPAKSRKVEMKKAVQEVKKEAPAEPAELSNYDKLLLEQSYRRKSAFQNAELIMAELEQAEKAGKLNFSSEQSTLYVLEQGKLNFDQGRFKESLPYFVKANQMDPNNATTLKYLAQVQYRTGNYALAAQTYEKVVQSDPQDMSSHLYRGMALFEAGNQAQAQLVIEDLMKQGVETGTGYYYLARIQQRKGNIQDAVSLCEKALLVDPSNFNASHLLKQLKVKTSG